MSTTTIYTKTNPSSPLLASPFKRKTMSITQTYYLAHKARAKLSSEAGRPDHNLRLLVGHANLLDSLMLELADAEREQESWFNQSVRGAAASPAKAEQQRHVQWADAVIEEPEEDWRAEDAEEESDDSDSDYDEEEDDVEMADVVSLRRVPSNKLVPPPPTMTRSDAMEFDDFEEDDEEDDEDYAELSLSRTPSHSASPPELDHDDESSEDESMPPSPPQPLVHSFTEKEREAIATTGFYEPASQQQAQATESQHKSFYDDGFYLPPRNPARLVSAISVY